MKTTTNIYDVDGEIIRKCGDNHYFTIEEAQAKIKYYLEKLKNLDKDDPDYILKASTYNQYVDNLISYTIRKKLYETNTEAQKPMNDDQIDIVDLEPVDETESVDSTK